MTFLKVSLGSMAGFFARVLLAEPRDRGFQLQLILDNMFSIGVGSELEETFMRSLVRPSRLSFKHCIRVVAQTQAAGSAVVNLSGECTDIVP